jgi:hypothetical protein
MACILYIQTPAGTMYAYRFSNRKAAERFYEIYQLSSECNSRFAPFPIYVETRTRKVKNKD